MTATPTTIPDNPFCSRTLRDLVREVVRPDTPNVHITALPDAPFFLDLFDRPSGVPGVGRVTAREVSVSDFEVLARTRAPELAAGFVAHVLAEYRHAAVSRRRMAQFANAHMSGLVAEARTVRDLTGRPIFEGRRAPSEQALARTPTRIEGFRHYGPGNSYSIILGPAPGFRVISATRLNARR